MSATKSKEPEIKPAAIIQASGRIKPDGSPEITDVQIDAEPAAAGVARQFAEDAFDLVLPPDGQVLHPRNTRSDGRSTHAVPDMSGIANTDGPLWGKMTGPDGKPVHRQKTVYNRGNRFIQ